MAMLLWLLKRRSKVQVKTFPCEIVHAVLQAAIEKLDSEGLSDIALRLVVVHKNPTLLKALYARISRWTDIVKTLFPIHCAQLMLVSFRCV